MTIATRDIEANGLTFSALEGGQDGEGVLLLHGFPETSHMWVPLLDGLAGEGYHAVAPDQRGYSAGARPHDVNRYRYEDLAADVHAIARALGWDRFHLVGHDWGAGAGWAALAVDPRPVRSWTTLSLPHYEAFAKAVRDDPEEEMYRRLIRLFTAPDAAAERVLSATISSPSARCGTAAANRWTPTCRYWLSRGH